MNVVDELLALERDFWTEELDLYRDRLAEDVLLVFPEPVGALTREATLEAIASAPRWSKIRMEHVRTLHPTDDCVILTYLATARREGDEREYRTLASSVYVRRPDGWKLAFHQHSPGTPEA